MVTTGEMHTITCIITDITVTEEDIMGITREHLITTDQGCKITGIRAKIQLVNHERKNIQNNYETRLKWINTIQLRMIQLDKGKEKRKRETSLVVRS